MSILSKYIRNCYTCSARGKGGLTVTCPPEETVTVEDVTTFEGSVNTKVCSKRFKSRRRFDWRVMRSVASLSFWGIVRFREVGVVVIDDDANDGIEEAVMEGRDGLDEGMTVGFA